MRLAKEKMVAEIQRWEGVKEEIQVIYLRPVNQEAVSCNHGHDEKNQDFH